jgi:hypothetical protein
MVKGYYVARIAERKFHNKIGTWLDVSVTAIESSRDTALKHATLRVYMQALTHRDFAWSIC